MKTIRLNNFETNSSSTHTLTITSGKKWDEFEAGTALYNNDYEKLYDSEELYTMFIEGDDDGDFKCDEYETYLKEKGCEKLSLDEFRYVIDHDFIAERCRQDRGFTFSDEICSEMDKKFGAAIQLNKEVFAIISRWMNEWSLEPFHIWSDDNELEWFGSEDVVDGVRVVAFGKYGYC